ncbi:MAG TPA: EAL domain-containing protein [Terriglobia bacterium]|nr:EAL domain-containing protein [Terriglobia bacterium]
MKPKRRSFALKATIGYAIFAALWIFLSDSLLAHRFEEQAVTRLAMAKGVVFVTVTSALLFLALRHASQHGPSEELPLLDETRPGRPWPHIVAILALCCGIGLMAWTRYDAERDAAEQAMLRQLQAIAKIKAKSIQDWLASYQADAETLSNAPDLIADVEAWQSGRNAVVYQHLSEMVEANNRVHSNAYRSTTVLTLDGDMIVSKPDKSSLVMSSSHDWPAQIAAAGAMLARGETAFVDLRQDPESAALHFSFIAPVMAKAAGAQSASGKPIAYVAIDFAPENYLFPSLLTSPLPSESGELALARREDDLIRYLYRSKAGREAAYGTTVPVDTPNLPLARFMRLGEQVMEGIDYRGVTVLAVVEPVPSTRWVLLAKIDRDEALAQVRMLGVVTTIATLAGLLTIIGFVAYFWQRRRLRRALAEVAERRALQLADKVFRETFEQAAIGIGLLSPAGRWLKVNGQFRAIFELDRAHDGIADRNPAMVDASAGEAASIAWSPDAVAIGRLTKGEIQHHFSEYHIENPHDGDKWADIAISLVRNDEGSPAYFVVSATDTTAKRETEQALKASEARLRQAAAVFTSTQEGVVITNSRAQIIAVNPAFCRITGYQEQELVGQNMRILQSGRQDINFYRALWSSIAEHGYWQGEIWNRRKGGEIYAELLTISSVRDESGQLTSYVGTFTDITKIKQSQSALEHFAHHDPLTDLPNRLLLVSRLDHAISQARRHRQKGAILLLDLDHFKNINDSLGHPAGDELLLAVTKRLQHRLRESDTLARLGGDEFVVMLEEISDPQSAALVAQSLLDEFTEPFQLARTQEVYIGTSIGISIFPDDSDKASELIQHADAALYQAKTDGRGLYRFYTSGMTDAALGRLAVERNLRRALERDEFILHYQPLVSLASGQIRGVEALVRWLRPGEGLIPPAQFIPVAEETGIIVPLGEKILRLACTQMKAWLDQGIEIDTLAVNLSPRQFRHDGLAQEVTDVLRDTALPAHYLELEITEGTLLGDTTENDQKLAKLKSLGLRIAIDDFGTGYSSLAYLKRMPINKLKIDRSFVHDIPQDVADREIAATIIAVAKILRLEVLAEGVETQAQAEFLRNLGCDTAQGNFFGAPLPADQLTAKLPRAAVPPVTQRGS